MKKLIVTVAISVILGFIGYTQVKAQNPQTGINNDQMSQIIDNQEQIMEMMKNMQTNMDKKMSDCMGMMKMMHSSESGMMMEHQEGIMKKQ